MGKAPERTARWNRYWDRKSGSYDREMRFWDRRLLGDSRQWACAQAVGEVLEVAVGTGLNLPFFPDDVTVTGVDLSERMLDIARARAADLGRAVQLQQGNAHALSFADASFDTVICTSAYAPSPTPTPPSTRWCGCYGPVGD